MNEPDTEPGTSLGSFEALIPFRVREILLVASPYDAFIFAEDDRLTEMIFSEYLDLNLHYAPRVTRADTAEEALERLIQERFDLVITMMRVGGMPIGAFATSARNTNPDLPIVLLAYNPLNIESMTDKDRALFNGIFLWSGDFKIILAIIKLIEDARNVEHDIRCAAVQTIILVENSARFYSYYLPLLYTEIMGQTHRLLAEGANPRERRLRQRARPKILLATHYEQAWDLYNKYRDYMLCLISDNTFCVAGRVKHDAGLDLIRRVKLEEPDAPVLLQTSDVGSKETADGLGASFLFKGSPDLPEGIRQFLKASCGFGDFVFRASDGKINARAADLQSFITSLKEVPGDSISYHAARNHVSKWLKARTEFELAYKIRSKRESDFTDVESMRSYLVKVLDDFLRMSRSGKVTDFSPSYFSSETPFVRMGPGSFGGKGRGLAYLNSVLYQHSLSRRWPGVRLEVPNTTVVTTDIFDAFLERNDLHAFLQEDPEDGEVCERFLQAELPPILLRNLEVFVKRVQYPLAVRSSSLMEDSQIIPLAGVYETYMLPNNHNDLSVRIGQLSRAIRLIYASTFYRAARSFLRSAPHKHDQEKMGVIIQRLAGTDYGTRFYPSISGVAQSYNYYSLGDVQPEDGLALTALGLGKTIVEGRHSMRFSPAHPRNIPNFSTTQDILRNSQRNFIGLNLSWKDFEPGEDSSENLVMLDLDAAEADGSLAPLASTYSPENDCIYDGSYRKGVRLVTLAEVLKGDRFPLAEILQELLSLGENAVGCPVEMEFAVDLNKDVFSILQMRPMASFSLSRQVLIDAEQLAEAACSTPKALGHGQHTDVFDLIYVKPDAFNTSRTAHIAREIGQLNNRFKEERRNYVLIGPGRWGSADHSLGIPVTWGEISAARVIVETSLPDFLVEPSYGTHFLHNVISLGVGYFSIRPERKEGHIDWDWLRDLPSLEESKFLRHVRLERPLDIRIDGRTGRGAVIKPTPS